MKSIDQRLDPLQVISLVLSVYVLGALIFETTFKISPETLDILDRIDFTICFFFLYEFGVRFYRAESKWKFMKWGWFDLISSIPVYGFQWIRVARVIRILRGLRSTRILVQFVYRDRAKGTLITAACIAVLMLIFSSVAVLNFETAPDSNIKTPEDAFWWAFTTISTVGYGDKYPVTTEGRITAMLLMTCGVGLFGVYTAFVASLFVAEDKKENTDHIQQLAREIQLLREELEKRDIPKEDNRLTSLRQESNGDPSDNLRS